MDMQVPYRKPGKFSQLKSDPIMTEAKLSELTAELEKLKIIRPQAAAEVARLAELGDFSENAEYQLAKGRLRGINNALLRLESQIHQAEIIQVTGTDTIRVGNTVTVASEGKEKKYCILGSSETRPEQGIISHNSPIGAALLGHAVDDEVSIVLGKKTVVYKILKID